MKIKDTNCFRRGNLIKHDWIDQNGVAQEYIKIQSIVGNSFVSVDSNKKPVYESIMLNDIKPITISEDWLLNFGFKKGKNSRDPFLYLELDTGLTLAVRFCGTDAHFISWDGTEFEGVDPPVYVHRLQNLCFALNSEELKLIKSKP